MKFTIDSKIVQEFPNLKIGIIVLNNINNKENVSEAVLKHTLDNCKKQESSNFEDIECFNIWNAIYKLMGLNPKKTQPSNIAFIKRVIKTSTVPVINPVVNGYLESVAVYGVPFGGYDLQSLTGGSIKLTYSQSGDNFEDISNKKSDLKEGEIIYKNGDDVLTRNWNYRDCYKNRITKDSNRVILMTEIFNMADTKIHEILVETSHRIISTAGGIYKVLILDSKTSLNITLE